MTKSIYSILFLLLCGGYTLKAQEVTFDENTPYRFTNAMMGEDYALDVNPEGLTLMMAPTGVSEGQFWNIISVGDGWFKFSCQAHENKMIDVINDGNNNRMALADDGNYSGQLWYIAPEGDDYYRIINGWQNEKALDCDREKNSSGAFLNPIGDDPGQIWRITEASVAATPTYPTSEGNESSIKIGDRAFGGIVFYVDQTGEHGLVCQESHFDHLMSFQDAKAKCEDSEVNEYEDWRMPHPEELLLMFHNLHMTDIATMGHTLYWSDHVSDEHHMWGVDLETAKIIEHEDADKSPVWAVRRFCSHID